MVEIYEVKTKKDLKRFVRFPCELYKDAPCFVPPLLSDELSSLNRSENPAFEYCEARYWLALSGDKIVGRIGAILNKNANKKYSRSRLRITRFDFIDDLEVSGALVKAVDAWARELGMDTLMGPIGFCDLDKEGMLVDGFDELNMFITYYNYPYYLRHMEAHGFIKETDWIEFQIMADGVDAERLERISRRALERYKLHMAVIPNKRVLRPYIYRIFDLLNETYHELYGAVLVTPCQVDYYVDQFIGFVNTKYLCIVENEQNNIVGFGLAVPSLSKAMKKARGRMFPFGWIPLARALYGKNDCLDMYFLAVTGDYRSKGLPAILLSQITSNAVKSGITYAETGPELESNTAVHSVWGPYKSRQHKRRRCFIRPVPTEE